MKESWKEFMRVGIVHFMAFPETIRGEGPVVETVRKVAEDDFFDAVDVTWIKDDGARAEVKRILTDRRKSIGYGAAPPLLTNKLSLNSPEESERVRAVDQVRSCLGEAIFLGARGMVVLSGPDPGPRKRKKQRAQLVKSLVEINRDAKSRDLSLRVVMEVFDRVPYGKNRLIGPTSEAIDISSEVRKEFPDFGIMVDLSHLPLLGETPEEALRAARPCLAEIHVGNCVKAHPGHAAYGDEHPPFGIPEGENGARELAHFLRILMEIGYLDKSKKTKPVVTFEVKPFGDWTSDKVIENCKRTLEEAWGLV